MTSTLDHKAHDHKSWLNDVDRWKYDLQVWENHHETMKSDAQAVVTAVEQFIGSVKDHKTAVAAVRKHIVDCERDMVEHKRSAEEATAKHRDTATAHVRCSDQHKRMEKRRHELMTLLASLTLTE